MKAKWEIMLAGRFLSTCAVMPEGPGALCLRWRMILLSSAVVMGGKEGSRMLMLEVGSGVRRLELAVMLLETSSMFPWSKSSSFWSFRKIFDQFERKSSSLSDMS